MLKNKQGAFVAYNKPLRIWVECFIFGS